MKTQGDDFNANDLADVSSDTPQPSEAPQLTPEQEANIDAALERAFGGADEAELEAEAAASDVADAEDSQKLADRRKAHRRQVRLEEEQELREEGLLEDDDEDGGEEAESAKKPDETPAAQSEDQEQDAEQGDQKKDATAADPLDPTIRYLAETELGWSKEKLEKFVAADPEFANEALGKLVEQYTAQSRQMIGVDGTQVAPGTPAPENTPAQEVYSPTPKLDKFFEQLTEQFAEANGEELTNFIKVLKEEVIDPFKTAQAKLEAEKVELRKSEAVQTFATLREKFPQLYGNGDTNLTPEQIQAKKELGRLADDLRGVAKQRGHNMSVKEALNRAHAVLAARFAPQTARKELTQQIQTRSRSLTAKPTNRTSPAKATGRSKDAAMEAVAQRAAALGIQGFED